MKKVTVGALHATPVLMAILALALVFRFAFTAYSSGDDPDFPYVPPSGGYPTALVAKWYASQEAADAGDSYVTYEFTSTGRLLAVGVDVAAYTATGTTSGTITTDYGSGAGGTADWAVSGTALTISNSNAPVSGLVNATLYKKAE